MMIWCQSNRNTHKCMKLTFLAELISPISLTHNIFEKKLKYIEGNQTNRKNVLYKGKK